jgi:hypothetical protein
LARICRNAGFPDAELLADALILLVEGARVSWQTVGPQGPGSRFVEVAEAVVAAFAERGKRAGEVAICKQAGDVAL